MKGKLKYIVILIIVGIVLLIMSRSCSKKFENRIREDVNKTNKTENEYLIKYNDDWEMLINHFLGENISFEEMPLSKKFIKRYKNLDDIISGKCTRESCDSFFDMENAKEKNIMSISYKTGNGFETIAYQLHYIINDKNELDDIEILDSKVIEDENGSYIKYEKYMTYTQAHNGKSAAIYFCNPVRYWDTPIYVTENFKSKYPNYKEKTILPWDEWLYVDEPPEKGGDKFTWIVTAPNIEETRKYKLTFITDSNDYVDDLIVEEIEAFKTENPEYVQSMYNDCFS